MMPCTRKKQTLAFVVVYKPASARNSTDYDAFVLTFPGTKGRKNSGRLKSNIRL
jgi:hypothetical protein